jgi:hypothetical protein
MPLPSVDILPSLPFHDNYSFLFFPVHPFFQHHNKKPNFNSSSSWLPQIDFRISDCPNNSSLQARAFTSSSAQPIQQTQWLRSSSTPPPHNCNSQHHQHIRPSPPHQTITITGSLPCFNANTDATPDRQAQQPPPAISL